VLLAWTLTCLIFLGLSTVVLLLLGAHLHVASRILALVCLLAEVVLAGQIAAAIWQLPSDYVIQAEILLAVAGVVVIGLRPAWNLAGQVFYAGFLAASVSFLVFMISLTFTAGLPAFGLAASILLLLLEVFALAVSGYFTFESLDATVRTRTKRPPPVFDPGYQPRVSLQVAAYNEPPDMLIETVRSLNAIDYPNLEIVIVDNNTPEEETWRPVEEFCRTLPRVKFFHADGVEGYKAGALNLSLRAFTDPAAEVIGIVDADYLVDPDFLAMTVGYFADPNLAFVQTPQDYREWEGDPYLTACYDAYQYFFATSMPSRNDRNSIIFAGTMGLIRRSALEGLEGWDEWCITEDAEASLRLLKAGWSGLYLHKSFGRGIMPLTFSALKSQRFRWCFGGIQILRKHLGDLLPFRRDPRSALRVPQRLDYLFGGIQWFMDLMYLGFSLVLVGSGIALLLTGHIGLPPLLGAAVLLPALLMVTGVMRALWALRTSTGIGLKRSVYAFLNWLSLSWTVSLADLQALVRRDGVFLRTPKWKGEGSLALAIRAARAETLATLVLWGMGVAVLVAGHASVFFAVLFFWQGGIYASGLYMSWLNQHTQLSEPLERRRRTEERRERLRALAPWVAGGTALAGVGSLAVALIFAGAFSPPGPTPSLLHVPHRAATDPGPFSALTRIPTTISSFAPALVTTNPTPAVIVSPAPGVAPSPSSLYGYLQSPSPLPFRSSPAASPLRRPSPSPSPVASPSTSPSISTSPSPSPSPSPSVLPSASPTGLVTATATP
jgi:cellulose synthase/poly-beta-1,6-N-acetylglucosamine synthase-like glycosyltransferase